ncbi:MAG: hypothetical protein U0792_13990 [Gemmataceae bacterium]
MRDAVRGTDGDLQRVLIGDASAVQVGGHELDQFRGFANLVGRPVNQHHADAQAPQQGDIEEQIREVVVFNDCAIDSDDEHAVAKAWHITQNFAEVSEAFVRGSGQLSVVGGQFRLMSIAQPMGHNSVRI